MNIGLTLVARGTVTTFQSFIERHRRLGITRFWFTLDDPTDDLLAFLATCNDVSTRQPEKLDHTDFLKVQKDNLAWAHASAWNADFHWLGHFDLDETVGTHTTIPALLAELPSAVVQLRFPTLEVQPLSNGFLLRRNPDFGPGLRPCAQPFESGESAQKAFAAKARLYRMIRRKPLPEPWFAGHRVGKSFVRLTSEQREAGPHAWIVSDGEASHCSTIGRCIHYDNPSFDVWHAKWERRIQTGHDAPKISEQRRQQVEIFRKAFESGTTSELYRSLYATRLFERLLMQTLGLLITVPQHLR